MLRVSIKSLLAHKLRLFLSGAAVILGVAFVAGTLIFTDTLGKTFDELFEQVTEDVTVQPIDEVGAGEPTASTRTVSEDLIDRIAALDGVNVAEGVVFVPGVQVVGKDDKVLGTPNAPTFGTNWSDNPDVSPLRLTKGREPTSGGELVVDEVTAAQGKLRVGDRITVVAPKGPIQATVVGIMRFGTTGNLAGATLAAFETDVAQDLLLDGDGYSTIAVDAGDGVSIGAVRDRIATLLPAGLEAKTADEVAEEQSNAIAEGLGFINSFLLVFAGIAVFVGGFIILNTFSILVAQRTRELALLRAVGASRRQVSRSVLIEALAVGIVGSTIGLLLGFGLAYGLQALLGLFGLKIPTTGLALEPRTVLWSYGVGVVVTVASAWLPARRAARVAPVAALRDEGIAPERSMRRRVAAGIALVALAAVAMAGGVAGEGGRGAMLVGAAALLGLIGAAVLSPVLSRPVVRAVTAPSTRIWGAVGRLSRENTMRNPRRTAATASALMIALALVSALSVLGTSAKASFGKLIDDTLGADFIAANQSQAPITARVARDLAAVDGVAAVSRARWDAVLVDGNQEWIAGVDGMTVDQAIAVETVAGSVRDVDTGGVAVTKAVATERVIGVGDTVPVTFRDGKADVPVVAVIKEHPALAGYVFGNDTLEQHGGQAMDQMVYVMLEDGADAAATQRSLEAAIDNQPGVQLSSQQEFKEQQAAQMDQILFLMYALLLLSVIIAALGIVNTLVLSVVERTREIGLLRAIGTSRRQIRRMIRLESVAISIFGALLGLGVGLVFGITLQRVLADDGIELLVVPVGQLVAFVVAAAVIGVLAAVWPAFKASRLSVLRAIASE